MEQPFSRLRFTTNYIIWRRCKKEQEENDDVSILVFTTALEIDTPENESSHGIYVDLEAKPAVIGLQQAEVYYCDFGEVTEAQSSQLMSMFSNKRHYSVNTL